MLGQRFRYWIPPSAHHPLNARLFGSCCAHWSCVLGLETCGARGPVSRLGRDISVRKEHVQLSFGGFSKLGTPKMVGSLVWMVNQQDDLGIPPFWETPKCHQESNESFSDINVQGESVVLALLVAMVVVIIGYEPPYTPEFNRGYY